jgi:hypothetical protein
VLKLGASIVLPASAAGLSRQGVGAAREAGHRVMADTSRDSASFWNPRAYGRLRQIKAAADSGNLIRSNHTIPPATALARWAPNRTPDRTTEMKPLVMRTRHGRLPRAW